jgi:hypothetical protein
MHAAGFLGTSNGSLVTRGTFGFYWSSKHSDAANSSYLSFSTDFSRIIDGPKAVGFSARCVREY